MKLLTFLGNRAYGQTTYTWQGSQFTTQFAPRAACEFLKPEKVVLFLTGEARQNTFPQFQQELGGKVPVETHAIPLGKDESELWQIFDQISAVVSPADHLAFDVTHGLRSFPMLSLLVAAYLRSAFDVEIEAVLYGAYDVRDQSTTPHTTAFFDLSPMLALLEWAVATDRFNQTGDSRYLAALLKDPRKNLARGLQKSGHKDRLPQLGSLNQLEKALAGISQATRLIRPHQVMQQAAELRLIVNKASPVLEDSPDARPFSLLLETVARSYAPLELDRPLEKAPRTTLETERSLILWYAEHEYWVQAISLAREWLVSWFMAHAGLMDRVDLAARKRIENAINSEASEYAAARESQRSFVPLCLPDIADTRAALGLWKSLADTRNDIDHAGMRPVPGQADSLVKAVRKHIDAIQKLALPPDEQDQPNNDNPPGG